MIIHGLEKLSLVDYDGVVAATVFTGGCNFRCPFCHNGVLVEKDKTLAVISEKEIFDYLLKRKGIIEGVCISGGEPTLNNDLPEFCEKIKKLDLKVKLDSNGTNPDIIKTLAENKLIDYVAMDIKNDRQNYAKIIGLDSYDTSKVEKSVNYLINGKINYEFRTTLIYEFHKIDNIIAIGKWIQGAEKYFLQKFKNGDNCLNAKSLTEVPEKQASEFLTAVIPFVKHANLRGYDLTG